MDTIESLQADYEAGTITREEWEEKSCLIVATTQLAPE